VSVIVEYYFNAPLELPAPAEQLNVALGGTLRPFQDEEHLTRLMGMPFELAPCTWDNDGELDFESYGYSVLFRTRGTKGVQEIQVPVSGTSLADFPAHHAAVRTRLP
jgi:hypothetical protein